MKRVGGAGHPGAVVAGQFGIVYLPSGMVGPRHEIAEWFLTEEAARDRAEQLLARHETKAVALVKRIAVAHTEVEWAQ